jgi:hypothetical protein
MEELTLAEEELIDDYVGERLSANERAEFERHFLSTEERHRQLRFTRALGRYADAARAEEGEEPAGGRARAAHAAPTFGERLRAFWGGRSWAPRAGLALAAVAVIVAAFWLARPPAPTEPRTFQELALNTSAADRGGSTQPDTVRLPLGADALKLTLHLPEGTPASPRYRAELLREGGQAEAVQVTAQDAGSVTVVVPSARLARGQYELKLFGVGSEGGERRVRGSYYFDVE